MFYFTQDITPCIGIYLVPITRYHDYELDIDFLYASFLALAFLCCLNREMCPGGTPFLFLCRYLYEIDTSSQQQIALHSITIYVYRTILMMFVSKFVVHFSLAPPLRPLSTGGSIHCCFVTL